VEAAHLQSAEALRERLGEVTPAQLHAALLAVPAAERDAWVDACLGLEGVPDDGPALPSGCVPYLPCPVDALLRVAKEVGPGDVVIDVGAGVGRAAALLHLLTGAAVLGVEVQPQLVRLAQALAARLDRPTLTFVEADIGARPELLAGGTVFFLYCPFSGPRLERLLDALEARQRSLCVACVDLPLPERPWLVLTSEPGASVSIHRSAPR
jgi:SAM-dependent methyltransferase